MRTIQKQELGMCKKVGNTCKQLPLTAGYCFLKNFMGNSFIDTNIRPIISSLAKQHKTIVVATHNANIAVRTLPYLSIFRTHQNGEYNTYIGNPFNDKLKNISDETDVKSWTKESLHTLEGGKEAFYERKSIYETSGE